MAAALAMQTAHELDPACSNHSEDLERLMRRIPLTVADVLEVGSQSGRGNTCLHLQADEPIQLIVQLATMQGLLQQ